MTGTGQFWKDISLEMYTGSIIEGSTWKMLF
jgi:hypothetical protein